VKPVVIGGLMFTIGFILTTYHTSKLFAPQSKVVSHVAWAMVGVGLFQIGSNLTASGMYDHLKQNA